jgi:tetratricopeptide (TPR) repeat protein
MKKNYLKQYYNFKSKSPSAYRFGSFLVLNLISLVLCLSVSFADEQFDPTDLLIDNPALVSPNIKTLNVSSLAVEPEQKIQKQLQTTGNPAVNSTANVEKDLPQNSSLLSKSPNAQPGHQLRQTSIETIKDPNNKIKNGLQQTIEKVQSVKFKPKNKTSESTIVINPASVPQTDSNETQFRTEVSEEKPQSDLLNESITKETLKIVEDASQNPEKIKNPFELGEILFHSGQLKQAGLRYQQALRQIDREHNGLPQNTAWILLQIGNCLKNDDPNTSVKMYERLVKEYPESIWTDMAKTQIDLINWLLKDKPQTFLKKN